MVRFRTGREAFPHIDKESLPRGVTPPTFCPSYSNAICTQGTRNVEMPPKDKKAQNKGKAGEEEREDPLQAVVCAAALTQQTDNANNLDPRRSLRDTLQSIHA